MVSPNSHEITVRFEKVDDEMSSTPGTMREDSPGVCPQTDRSCNGTDTDNYMQSDVNTSLEQPNPTHTNPRASKYDARHNSKPKCNDDYRY